MNEILSVVLGGMHNDLTRMERISMNLANAQTAGYKREVVSATPFAARLAAFDSAAAAPVDRARPAAIHTDLRPGTLKATGQRLHLAIAGSGWFEVSTAQGPAYTRQGNFRLDALGRLVTQQGHPVMGVSGEIQLAHGAPVVDAAGAIYEGALPGAAPSRPGAAPVAQLKIVQFEAGAALQRLGDGLVSFEADGILAAEGTVRIEQGFLENSNVSHMQEMVRLVETMRHLESMQKVAVGYDEMLATSIRKLGEPA